MLYVFPDAEKVEYHIYSDAAKKFSHPRPPQWEVGRKTQTLHREESESKWAGGKVIARKLGKREVNKKNDRVI